MDLPTGPPPDRRRLGVHVVVRVGDVPVDDLVLEDGARVAVPVSLEAHRDGQGFVLAGAQSEARVGLGGPAYLEEGPVDLRAQVVPRFRHARLSFAGIDPTVLLLIVGVSLVAAQVTLLSLLFARLAGGGADGGLEVSPEYLARLLRGENAGEERGLLALPTERPAGGEKIEQFYLQPGHAGPVTRMGGGANLGAERRIGSPGAAKKGRAPPIELGAGEEPVPLAEPAPVPEAAVAEADAAEVAEGEDQPIGVEVNEGWGFSDWYDTEDARQDAKEIRRELELAHKLLRLDPDNPAGLQVRAYYEYLAMDYAAARKTYERFTQLYPEEAAGWNNLGLTYKRVGDYQKEEELYRYAMELDPLDDVPINNLAVALAHQGRFEEAMAEMDKLEVMTPGDPYADLHRAKIYAAWGKEERAYHFLQKALSAMRKLDTLHNIEFRQDIRLDPAFAKLREEKRFRDLLLRYYGDRPEGWWQRILR